MTYTRIALISCLTLATVTTLHAETQQKLNIDQATVFLKGAELISSARITLVKGENEVLFTNVAGDINTQSIIINAGNGVVVESISFQNNYLAAEAYSPRAQEIKDSMELLNQNRQSINDKIAVLNEQIAVLQDNRKVGGSQSGLSVTELTKMLDLINSRMEGYLTQKNKQNDIVKKIDERLAKLKMQLDEELKKGYQPGGQLLVKFFAKEATTTPIVIDYVVPNAGWTPTYDIIADDAQSPVKLFYKANIFQNSGVKWNNVRLSLSTGNPNEGAQAPVLSPWYLAFYTPQTYSWQQKNQVPMQMKSNKLAMDEGGAWTANDRAVVDGVTVNSNTSMNNYVSVDNSGINTSFDIDLPYTIPSDGQQHLVAIKRYELPATYRYYVAPRLDKDAFLQAQITNWEDLNLLPGETNIFYEGTYVGRGVVDTRNVKDTMTISLGRDKKVVVKRVRDTKLRSVKMIGTNIRETFAYSITVRNARKEPVSLVIQDQVPVSTDKDIIIEEKDYGGSEADETTGFMKWVMTLNANETKSVNFGFTVKYPKGKTVSGL